MAAPERRQRPRPPGWRQLACWLLLGLTATAWPARAAPPGSLRVHALDARVLELPGDGRRNRLELSDLAWDAGSGEVWAVSDRGWLHRWQVEIEQGRLVAVLPQSKVRLEGRPNLEALALRRLPGQAPLLAIDEQAHQWLEVERDGRIAARHALPAALAGAGRQGVEAMAWHPQHGLLLVAQRQADGEHQVRPLSGAAWRLPAPAGAEIRAMSWLGEHRLLLLERLKQPGSRQVRLRLLDLRHCQPGQLCQSEDALLQAPALRADDKLEGLSCVDQLCLVVSDDGDATATRSLLLLLEVWPGRP